MAYKMTVVNPAPKGGRKMAKKKTGGRKKASKRKTSKKKVAKKKAGKRKLSAKQKAALAKGRKAAAAKRKKASKKKTTKRKASKKKTTKRKASKKKTTKRKASKKKTTKRKASKKKTTKRKVAKKTTKRKVATPKRGRPPVLPPGVPKIRYTTDEAEERLSRAGGVVSSSRGLSKRKRRQVRGISKAGRRMQLASHSYLQLNPEDNPVDAIPGHRGLFVVTPPKKGKVRTKAVAMRVGKGRDSAKAGRGSVGGRRVTAKRSAEIKKIKAAMGRL